MTQSPVGLSKANNIQTSAIGELAMKKVLGVILFFTFGSAQAAIIDFGASFSDTDSGLEWLKMAPTLNRSYDDVSSKFGATQEFDGWRYATGAEFEELMLNLGHVPDGDLPSPDFDGNTIASCSGGVNFCGNYIRRDTIPAASALLNSTSDLIGNVGSTINPGVEAYTRGIIADIDTGNVDPTAHFTSFIIQFPSVNTGLINSWYDSVGPTATDTTVGSYLVKTEVVPVPAAAWLFASSLGILGWVRRKKAT
jgi:hypothetical protein